jgi:hypothetical protein
MSSDDKPPRSPANSPAPRRASRWSAPRSSPKSPYRLVFRLLGIPVIAVAAVILYRGLRTHFVLPECDSAAAKQTLAQVLKQLKLEPVRYAPITTVSSTKDRVVCHAAMPLPDGASVVADYTFYWQGDKADMSYTVHRQAAQSSSLGPVELAGGLPFVRSWTKTP